MCVYTADGAVQPNATVQPNARSSLIQRIARVTGQWLREMSLSASVCLSQRLLKTLLLRVTIVLYEDLLDKCVF